MPCNSAAVVARPDLIEDEVKANSRLTYMAASQKSFGIPTWQYRRETNYQRHYRTTTAASSLRRWEAYFRSVIAVNSTHLHSAAPNVHRASHSSPMVPSQPTSRPSSHNAPDLMRRRLNRNSVGIRANCFRMST